MRILVIKPDHLGDLLLATPALRHLRASQPSAKIVGMVGPWSQRIWQGNPDLDRLTTFPFPGFARDGSRRRSLRPYFQLLQAAALLRPQRYAVALLLRDDHWWGTLMARLAGIPRRIGQAHPRCAPHLTDALAYDPGDHVTRQALAVVAQVCEGGIPVARLGDPGLRFDPTLAEQRWAEDWCVAQLAQAERAVLLHPGTGGPSKHWPLPHWIAVAETLAAQPGLRLILTGGPDEVALAEQLAAQLSHPVLNLAGQTSLGQLTALQGRAALVLGVDSGPLHLALSQGTPTIHLFGPSDAQRFGPWGDPARHRVLRAGIACSPCGVFAHCPRGTAGPECMAAISPGAVIAASLDLLAVG
ncbi:MAG: glycosyltransferase family 9 protein [Oscillochloridaceae bacterium umkhey_bin13]